MPADRFVSLAQLAVKAAKIAKGDALIPSIQKQQAKLVLLSTASGANRAKKIRDKCATYKIPLLEVEASRFEKISPFISGALAILDEGFASGIQKYSLEKDGD